MSYILWVLFIIAILQHQQIGAITAAVRKPNTEFSVTCHQQNTTPIDACGVRVWVENEKGEDPPTPPLDFNAGTNSSQQTRRSDNNDVLFKGKYSGGGLLSGECGVTLSELREGRYFIMCRTHVTDLDEWYSESTSLIVQQDGVDEDADSLVTHFSNQTVAQSRDSQPFEFTSSEAIDECRLFLPERPVFTLTKQDNTKRTSEYEAILEDRKCSVTLFKVTLRSSGPIWVLYRGSDERWRAFAPQLLFVHDMPGKASMTMANATATCSVPPGLPAARLRWTVNGKTVRKYEGSVSNAWEWPWISQPVQQRYKVESSDKDQSVECHVYWPDFNTEVNTLEETIPGMSESITTTLTPSTTTSTTCGSTSTNTECGGCLTWLVWVLTVVVVLLIVILAMCFRERTGLPLCWCTCFGPPPKALTSKFKCCSKKHQHICCGIGLDEEQPAHDLPMLNVS